MIVFTAAQKVVGQTFIDRINAFMQQRYGPKAFLMGWELTYVVPGGGAIKGVRAMVQTESPPDADGDVARPIKYIEIWD